MTVVNLQIDSNTDDASEINDTTFVDDDGLLFGNYSNDSRDVCFRWDNVAIDKGAIVSSAIFSGYYWMSSFPSVFKSNIKGIAEDNPTTWTSESRPSTRAKGDEVVRADRFDWTPSGNWYKIDIAPIINELVNRDGWVSGNAIAIVIENAASWNSNYIIFKSHNNNASYGAKLDVTYVLPTEYTFTTTFEQHHNIHIIRDEE